MQVRKAQSGRGPFALLPYTSNQSPAHPALHNNVPPRPRIQTQHPLPHLRPTRRTSMSKDRSPMPATTQPATTSSTDSEISSRGQRLRMMDCAAARRG